MNQSGIERKNRTIARFSLKNLAVWLACFLASYALWCYVRINESSGFDETYDNIPVTLTHKDELGERGLSLYSGEGNVISVKLSGKYSALPKTYETDKITAYADLNQVQKSGRTAIEVKVKAPDGCTVVSQSMKTIFVDADEQMVVNLDVTPFWDNNSNPAEGCTYDYSMAKLVTNAVTIIGPKQEVVKIQSVRLNVDLADVQWTETVMGDVELLDENGEVFESTKINYSPNQIAVTIPVKKEVTKSVDVLFEDGFLNSSNASVKLNPSTVTLTGERDVMEQDALLAPVRIDESQAFENGELVLRRTVELEPAEGVTVAPAEAEITVTVDPSIGTKVFSIPSTEIIDDTPEDIKTNLDYELDRAKIDVRLMGNTEFLESLSEEDLELHLDMSSYKVLTDSKYKLSVKVPSADEGEVLVLGSYGIKVLRNGG